ncbi:MAG: metal ABC transporter permease, partial [Pseudomonadota bacterium]
SIRPRRRIAPGAAMGVVFTSMFAAGVLMLEASDASSVHLDVEHALHGNLESLIWLDGLAGWSAWLDPDARAGLPPELARMAWVFAVLLALTLIFRRPLALSTFDEGYARALGLPTTLIGFGLVAAAAAAAVAAFDAVGSILAIAMFICPPAAARLCTDRLSVQIALSLAFATLSAVLGVALAGWAPAWLGLPGSVSAAGMIAWVAGAILALACLFGPRRARAGGVEGAV